MTKLDENETEADLVIHEDGVWALNFEQFFEENPLFDDSCKISSPEFVTEVITKKIYPSHGAFSCEDIVSVNDTASKLKIFKQYFSEENPKRLYRFRIQFYLCFHNWIDSTQSFSEMLLQLENQYEAVSLMKKWHDQGKIDIINAESSPSFLFFLVTPDIFHEALTKQGIGHEIIDLDQATLAQNHFLAETEKYRKKLGLK